MRIVSLIILLLFFISGCEKSIWTNARSFVLEMKRYNAVGPCSSYDLKIQSDGKVAAERRCVFFVECEQYESNGVSVKKRKCPSSESEEIEKQLSGEEMKELLDEIDQSQFFSFRNDYKYDSKNCSQISTDSPSVVLTIKTDAREKTIEHYHGCWVNNWLGEENALQPLTNLENKINQIVGIENWTRGQK